MINPDIPYGENDILDIARDLTSEHAQGRRSPDVEAGWVVDLADEIENLREMLKHAEKEIRELVKENESYRGLYDASERKVQLLRDELAKTRNERDCK